MTLRPDDDLTPDTGSGPATDGVVPVEGVPATEDVSSAGDAGRIDEEPDLGANRTDVEDSPTGHS